MIAAVFDRDINCRRAASVSSLFLIFPFMKVGGGPGLRGAPLCAATWPAHPPTAGAARELPRVPAAGSPMVLTVSGCRGGPWSSACEGRSGLSPHTPGIPRAVAITAGGCWAKQASGTVPNGRSQCRQLRAEDAKESGFCEGGQNVAAGWSLTR